MTRSDVSLKPLQLQCWDGVGFVGRSRSEMISVIQVRGDQISVSVFMTESVGFPEGLAIE